MLCLFSFCFFTTFGFLDVMALAFALEIFVDDLLLTMYFTHYFEAFKHVRVISLYSCIHIKVKGSSSFLNFIKLRWHQSPPIFWFSCPQCSMFSGMHVSRLKSSLSMTILAFQCLHWVTPSTTMNIQSFYESQAQYASLSALYLSNMIHLVSIVYMEC